MISLNALFYIFVILFALIGIIRGVRKEIVVVVSGVLAVFIIEVIVTKFFPAEDNTKALITNLIILFVLAFFGYQTPANRRLSDTGRFDRSTLSDMLFGGIAGALNGYIFFSSAWYYLAKAAYPFSWISAPDEASEVGLAALKLLENSFPMLVTGPWLYGVLAATVAILLVVIL